MKIFRPCIALILFWIVCCGIPCSANASEIDFGLSIVPYPTDDALLPDAKLRIESLDQLIPNVWEPMDPDIDFRNLLLDLPENKPKKQAPIFVFGESKGFAAPMPPLTIEKIEVEFYQPYDVGYIDYHPLDIAPEKVLMEDYGEMRGIVTYIPKAQVVISSELSSKVYVLKEPGLQKGEAPTKPAPVEVAKAAERETPEGVGEIAVVDEKKKKMGTAGEFFMILLIGLSLVVFTPFKKLFTAIMLIFLWIYYWQPVASFFAKLLF
ncbi:hypothetical protein [Desulfatirhabdium butyrativorans]|uniref:hypothetical protein n=1 Tax=Desulfatirhabdium butyrativorans TaxID=340467 RepID=UPI0003FF937E|nr:hypothetical protein [Desulfatirhabdium butyrativorans]